MPRVMGGNKERRGCMDNKFIRVDEVAQEWERKFQLQNSADFIVGMQLCAVSNNYSKH